jgi:ribosomal protein L29
MDQTSNSMRIAHTTEELLSLYDTSFVECAYRTILGREVDPSGLRNYLIQVRKGVSKGQIAAELAVSQEGRTRVIELPGIAELIKAYEPRRRTWISRLFRRAASQARQGLEMQLRSIENGVGMLANEMSTHYETLDTRLAESKRETADLRAELSTRNDELNAEVAELKAELLRLSLCIAWPSTGTNATLEGLADRDPTSRISVDQLMPNVLRHANRVGPKVPTVPSATNKSPRTSIL